jgi:hypothetical protein
MVIKRDIYASAKLLIKQHRSKAEDVVTEKMLQLMEHDDVKGALVWLAILNAINDLEIREQQKHLH